MKSVKKICVQQGFGQFKELNVLYKDENGTLIVPSHAKEIKETTFFIHNAFNVSIEVPDNSVIRTTFQDVKGIWISDQSGIPISRQKEQSILSALMLLDSLQEKHPEYFRFKTYNKKEYLTLSKNVLSYRTASLELLSSKGLLF